MNTGRLEAFSDGVLAILITIMVLELRVPHGVHLADLRDTWPILLSYVLSFVYIGIYWSNHHHMLFLTERVTGGIMWANLHLLFWLSLVPFVTAWMGENHFAAITTTAYGVNLLLAAGAFFILQRLIMHDQPKDAILRRVVGRDWKGKCSPILYGCGIAASTIEPWVGLAFYALVAIIWLIPDRRIERAVT